MGRMGTFSPNLVQMNLEKEFATDLRTLSTKAHDLRLRLEAVQSK